MEDNTKNNTEAVEQRRYQDIIRQLAYIAVDCETNKLYKQEQALYKAIAVLEDL